MYARIGSSIARGICWMSQIKAWWSSAEIMTSHLDLKGYPVLMVFRKVSFFRVSESTVGETLTPLAYDMLLPLICTADKSTTGLLTCPQKNTGYVEKTMLSCLKTVAHSLRWIMYNNPSPLGLTLDHSASLTTNTDQ